MGSSAGECETYWTPGRVRFWLTRYVDLRRAVRYGCAVDAMGEDVGVMPVSRTNRYTDLATHLLCVKCDLDQAMKKLDDKEREALVLHFGGGLLQREIARLRGVSQQALSRTIRRAIGRMAKWLG